MNNPDHKISSDITRFVATEIIPAIDDYATQSGYSVYEIAVAVALACGGFLNDNGITPEMLAAAIRHGDGRTETLQ